MEDFHGPNVEFFFLRSVREEVSSVSGLPPYFEDVTSEHLRSIADVDDITAVAEIRWDHKYHLWAERIAE
jgi:hypothetical protein